MIISPTFFDHSPEFSQFLDDLLCQGHPAPSVERALFVQALLQASDRLYVPAADYWYEFKVNGFRLNFAVVESGVNGVIQLDPNQTEGHFDYSQRFDQLVDYIVYGCWDKAKVSLDFYLFDAHHVPASFHVNHQFAAKGLNRWELFCKALSTFPDTFCNLSPAWRSI